uniref:Uncharacterized protein n=1 Tax=Rhizophora mucronata TaxID=61149 RepID=A0A2P2PSN7_RHIMU
MNLLVYYFLINASRISILPFTQKACSQA